MPRCSSISCFRFSASWANDPGGHPAKTRLLRLHARYQLIDDVRAHRRVRPEVLGLDSEPDVERFRQRERGDDVGALVE
jgi:hypothetical protein